MARKKLEVNPKQSQRLKQILQEQHKSQKWLADQINISERMISTMVNGLSAITPETADKIKGVFPKYRMVWLLGYDDYKTEEELVINSINTEIGKRIVSDVVRKTISEVLNAF